MIVGLGTDPARRFGLQIPLMSSGSGSFGKLLVGR
jgi:hypothetical protein